MPDHAQERLPTETVPAATGRGLAVTVGGVLLFVLLSNWAAGLYLARYTRNEGYRLIAAKWELLEAQREPVDWLLLGDSSCNQGLDPALFPAAGEGTALNLCTVGDLLSAHDVWMLERYLERVGPPRRGVVITHVYDVWHRKPKTALLGKVPLDWGYWDRREPRIELGAAQQRQLFLARYAPLWTENESLKEALAAPGSAFEERFHFNRSGFKVEEQANPRGVERDAAAQLKFASKKRFRMSKVNDGALRRLASLAEQHRLELWLVNSPLYEGLPKEPRFQAYYADVVKSVGAIVATSPRLHYLFREPMTFPKSQMTNADHLTSAGAKLFTERLIEELRRPPGPDAGAEPSAGR